MTWRLDTGQGWCWYRKVRYENDTSEYLELVKEYPDFFVVKYGKRVTMPDGCREDHLIGETYPTDDLEEAIRALHNMMRED